MRIGIDFDNTIASYDHAFVSLSEEWGLMDKGAAATKLDVRTSLRAKNGGEHEWQRLQGQVYGAEIQRAELIEGVGDFLKHARSCKDEIFIVSHKTKFGHFDPNQVNLQDAALDWMNNQGFFNPDIHEIALNHVFFLPTREEKIARISALNLDWFIDDLPEVLSADSFPANVGKILFSSNEFNVPYAVKRNWKDIQAEIYP